jgi:hypothetical protein
MSVEALPKDKVWVYPSAVTALKAAGVDLPEPDSVSISAARDPDAWRRLQRERRFDAVLLAGNWSEIAPLAKHLRESGDFAIAKVDSWGIVFRRGSDDGWQAPAAETLVAQIGDPQKAASELSQMAMMLQVLGEGRAARQYLTAANKLAPGDSLILARAATVDLMRGRLAEAVAGAEEVLRQEPDHVIALQIKAQALAKAGAIDEAWAVAEELVQKASPKDMVSFLLHARLAHEARAYQREQESLERLVALADQARVPALPYRVLLSQVYAKRGLGRQALEQLTIIRADPTLAESEQADIDTSIETLKRAGF